MININRYRNLTWVDLESPTGEEVRRVVEEYHINPLVADELFSPSIRPRVDLHHNFIYLSLHFPAVRPKQPESAVQEIDFIVGKEFIITTRYSTIDPIHMFTKVFEVHSILNKKDLGDHAGYIFYHIIREMYGALISELEFIEGRLDEIKNQIFRGREREMVSEISLLSRTLLDFKRAIVLHRNVLESFEAAGKNFFGESFSYHLRAIVNEYFRIDSAVRSGTDSLNELRETNDTLLTTKQNEIMKVLTIVSFIALPLTLVATLLQIDTVSRPIVGKPHDFWIILGFMALTALFQYLFFKKIKKWL